MIEISHMDRNQLHTNCKTYPCENHDPPFKLEKNITKSNSSNCKNVHNVQLIHMVHACTIRISYDVDNEFVFKKS